MPSSATPPSPTSTLLPYTTLFRSPLDHDRLPLFGTFGRGRQLDGIFGQLTAGHRAQPTTEGLQRQAAVERGRLVVLGDQTLRQPRQDRKSTRLNSSHLVISYAVFCYPPIAHLYSPSLHDALPISPRPRSAPPVWHLWARPPA